MYGNLSPEDEYSTKIERIIGENTDLTRDLENWMSKLPQSLKLVPIIYLAIPGSHDSFTSNITAACGVSPDSGELLQDLHWLICVKTIIARWTKTQSFPVNDQLKSGIRYFDLRISTKKNDSDLYFCHGMYSFEVKGVLSDISLFLETHSHEVST